MLEERLLVWQLNRGRPEALREIYERRKVELGTLATALLADKAEAEDVVHDVFAGFLKSAGTFRLTGSLKGFLATCVANRAWARSLWFRVESGAGTAGCGKSKSSCSFENRIRARPASSMATMDTRSWWSNRPALRGSVFNGSNILAQPFPELLQCPRDLPEVPRHTLPFRGVSRPFSARLRPRVCPVPRRSSGPAHPGRCCHWRRAGWPPGKRGRGRPRGSCRSRAEWPGSVR